MPNQPQPPESGSPDASPVNRKTAKEKRSSSNNGTESDLRKLLRTLQSARDGDFSIRYSPVNNGVLSEIAEVLNQLLQMHEERVEDVVRVSKIIGEEGRLTERMPPRYHSGGWYLANEAVNSLINSLVQPTAEVGRVITAVAKGELTEKMRLEIGGKALKGEFLQIGTIVNTMVDQLSSFAEQVTRVAREVGTEGKLGGQADVRGVAGTWKALTDNVNAMANSLTVQVRNIAEVTTAVARGDLSRKITVEARGEILELKNTINTMVDQLNAFAAEVTRVAREVGTEGKLGGQADVRGVAGTWKDLTDNVNRMANNLTDQVRNIAQVTTAVAQGDLSKKITVEVKGEILELKNTINTMVDQLNAFAAEVTRVAREVGTEGELGGQADVKGVAGTWKDLTDSVNKMASNLTDQVRNIAQVTTAVAQGDLSKKITVEVKGEILELKNTINTMVDQLNAFAAEVTRVAREVGTEGKLGGQADVRGVAGTWKDLTDSVNKMANNLTEQVRNIAQVTTAVAQGDLSTKITVEARGEILELKNTINTMVDQLNAFASEVSRVAKEVGTDGKLGGQAQVKGVSGTWRDLTENVNRMADNLTDQVRNIALVTTGVANGDLSQKITVDARGEILQLKNTINRMVDQLNSFASEVSRVAKEVGTEGKLGGQAEIKGVAGVWKDLTDNVNRMASNLTDQVRNIAQVTTAVALGNLSKKITVEVKGEILELKNTINTMVDQLNAFAAEVTRVAREVGFEGKLGGQAKVEGVAGTWKDLTDNVNQLAANLTTQVRAIAEVSTAVTRGDLTRSVAVEAQGEVEELKNNINQMIDTLRDTTKKNFEQDWLKTNLAKFSRMLQGQRDLQTVAERIMSELTPLVSAQHGVFYVKEGNESSPILKLLSTYAYKERKSLANKFHFGEGVVGQCALEKKPIQLTNVPDDYIRISSGLGEASPRNIVVLPILFEGDVLGVTELASFEKFSEIHLLFLEQLMESLGVVINMISAMTRTEQLLRQSQTLAAELQSQQQELRRSNEELADQTQALKESQDLLRAQQEELQRTNEDLEEQARLLGEQKKVVELKNRELEMTQASLEEKAEQLAITSKYKSEFLANMSHELRTPLNSVLLLAKLLGDNKDNNLSEKQQEYLSTIHSAGTDLLTLINEVLDLSKVEAGKMELNVSEFPLTDVRLFVERGFRQLADQKGLRFEVQLDETLPEKVRSDSQRLQQVLRNLISNAIKFTETGSVILEVKPAGNEIRFRSPALQQAKNKVIAFSVIDTGIGIPADKHKIIFEAFQQVETGTDRRFGGTGLGLTISRELVRMLGGEITVASTPGRGSVFTLYLPDLPQPLVSTNAFAAENAPAPTRLITGPVVSSFTPLSDTVSQIADDRYNISPGDKVVLIVEDDERFARVLQDIATQKGFKVLVANKGDTGLALAHEMQPSAIIMDLDLPVISGWTLLERLKHHPRTRHIPVHIITVMEDEQRGLREGAVAFLTKPVTKEGLEKIFLRMIEMLDRGLKHLLVVEDDQIQRESILNLIGNEELEATAVSTATEALALLNERKFDCMVVDLMLPDMDGFRLIEQIRLQERLRDLPIVVYTARDMTEKEESLIKHYADTIVIKGANSPERLLEEVSLFLHMVEEKLPKEKRAMLDGLRRFEDVLGDKKVLIVDDDVRNIFALTGVLESSAPPGKPARILFAENGYEALDVLGTQKDVDLILMDIMMPGMDGYETIRRLRQTDDYKTTPIIAVTAKAMKGDREKCLNAGASDYIAKPVDVDHLLSLLRVWLYR